MLLCMIIFKFMLIIIINVDHNKILFWKYSCHCYLFVLIF